MDVLLRYLKQIAVGVAKEFPEGGKQHDLVVDTESNRLLCDVGVTCLPYKTPAPYPQDQDVQNRITEDLQLRAEDYESDFFFEDRRDEEENAEVLRLRTFRKLALNNLLAALTGPSGMLTKKRQQFLRDYHPVEGELYGQFHGFVLSAGGGAVADVSWLLRWAVRKKQGRTRDRVAFRRDVSGRISLVLVRYASIMSRIRALRSLS